jgi:phosphatidate cytidylyltransferase
LSNAWLRIITALIGIPLVLAAVYLGGGWFVALVVAAALLAQWEVYTMLEAGGAFPVKAVGIALWALVAVRSVFAPALPLALLGVLGLLAYSPFLKRGDQPLSTLASTLFGVVYPTLLFSFLIDLRKARGPDVGAPEAFRLTLAVFFFIWAADTLAYVAGRALGKHKLAPSISPKKTWEGFIGGIVGAVLVGVALKYTWLGYLAWPHVLVLALIGGIVGPLGDLAEKIPGVG